MQLLQELHNQLAERRRKQQSGGGLTTTEAMSTSNSLWESIMGASKAKVEDPAIKGLYLFGGSIHSDFMPLHAAIFPYILMIVLQVLVQGRPC